MVDGDENDASAVDDSSMDATRVAPRGDVESERGWIRRWLCRVESGFTCSYSLETDRAEFAGSILKLCILVRRVISLDDDAAGIALNSTANPADASPEVHVLGGKTGRFALAGSL